MTQSPSKIKPEGEKDYLLNREDFDVQVQVIVRVFPRRVLDISDINLALIEQRLNFDGQLMSMSLQKYYQLRLETLLNIK